MGRIPFGILSLVLQMMMTLTQLQLPLVSRYIQYHHQLLIRATRYMKLKIISELLVQLQAKQKR